jgi:periplasmic protein CpxP/Spy
MTLRFRVLTGLAAASSALCLAATSAAQEPPPGPPSASQDGPGKPWTARMQARSEARARALHVILNIRPDQEAAFGAFVATMKPNPDGKGGHGDRAGAADLASLTTPQRLDRMAAAMADRQARFQQRAAAVRRFYAALSPEQQRSFDSMTALMGGGRDGRRGMDGQGSFRGPSGRG